MGADKDGDGMMYDSNADGSKSGTEGESDE